MHTTYLAVLSSGPVPDSPLEVCLGLSLDDGVDGALMAIVAPPVSPLEGVGGGHVDVLEVVVPGVGAVSPGLGEGDAARSSGSRGLGRGEAKDQTQAKHLV